LTLATLAAVTVKLAVVMAAPSLVRVMLTVCAPPVLALQV